jgi:hypothetical protein
VGFILVIVRGPLWLSLLFRRKGFGREGEGKRKRFEIDAEDGDERG